MVKVYKMEITIIDHEDSNVDDIINEIESIDYWSINVDWTADPVETEWSDDHPLNNGASYDDWIKNASIR